MRDSIMFSNTLVATHYLCVFLQRVMNCISLSDHLKVILAYGEYQSITANA